MFLEKHGTHRSKQTHIRGTECTQAPVVLRHEHLCRQVSSATKITSKTMKNVERSEFNQAEQTWGQIMKKDIYCEDV